ncbi:MAG: diacylglycerol kinase family protein [bacterium]
MERNRSKEFVVILNENARKVTRRVHGSAEKIVPRISLYSSRTKEEAQHIIREALDRGYHRIISGGGDGTFSHLLSSAKHCLEEKNAQLHKMGRQARDGLSRLTMPEFGVLRLGTGNSLAPVLGIGPGLKPVQLLARGRDFATRRFNMIEAEGKCFTFCGLGWDAQILNDYAWLKEKFQAPWLTRFTQNLVGYLAAILLRTIPTVALTHKPTQAIARCVGTRLYRIRDDRSIQPLECPPGEAFYAGSCNMVGVATTPYYGYHLKAFPYAMARPGLMHVRIIKAGVPELLAHAASIWQGTYRSSNVVDYLAEGVDLTFSAALPFQIGGDAEGYRKRISLQVSQLTVNLLDFARPLLPSA